MQAEKICNIVTTAAVAALMLFLMAWMLVMPKADFSESENKLLAKPPRLTLSTLADASFMKDTETYITDHFPFRTLFLQTKTVSEMILGKTEKNGVVFGADGYLIQAYANVDEAHIANAVTVINDFTGAHPELNLTLMIVPNSVEVNEKRLPAAYTGTDQESVIADIYAAVPSARSVALCAALKRANASQPMYYRLDHHWTAYAAYEAYRAYCAAANLDSLPADAFDVTVVADDFYGTMASKASVFDYVPDSIVRFIPKRPQNIRVSYCDASGVCVSQSTTLYADDYLSAKDKYASFLNANQPLVIIENLDMPEAKKLLVVKDSYANCLVPFLTQHYSTVYVVDLRYYALSVSELMARENITDGLILYSLTNLNTDTGIFSLK